MSCEEKEYTNCLYRHNDTDREPAAVIDPQSSKSKEEARKATKRGYKKFPV